MVLGLLKFSPWNLHIEQCRSLVRTEANAQEGLGADSLKGPRALKSPPTLLSPEKLQSLHSVPSLPNLVFPKFILNINYSIYLS